RRPEGARPPEPPEPRVGPEREHAGVGDVEHAHDAVHHREPEGHERVEAPHGETVDQLLGESAHTPHPALSPEGRGNEDTLSRGGRGKPDTLSPEGGEGRVRGSTAPITAPAA